MREGRASGRVTPLILTLDTTFFLLHYSKDEEVLGKSRTVLPAFKIAGISGLVPRMVLAEFYAETRKRAGRDVAELRLKEVAESGVELVERMEARIA